MNFSGMPQNHHEIYSVSINILEEIFSIDYAAVDISVTVALRLRN